MKKLLLFFLLATGCYTSAFCQKGYVTQTMAAGRIVAGDSITSTGQLPYFKSNGAPFSVFLIPKSDANLKEVEIVRAQYYQGDAVEQVPLVINAWNNAAIIRISADAINNTLISNYKIFIGFGQQKPQ